MTPKQRLELFVPVCNAIQHAHQKGIIHRDIKPSNVLIALYDDRPVPKVIDFGIAKATGGTLTEHTIETAFGGVVGTPQYMSPEQASLNNLDIDTRSDVYSLGVLLYELLAGSPPFARKELQQAGLLEILRVVREEEPPRPSTKLSTADALPSLSASRGTEPKQLTRLLRNELDWVVMKSLEKDRTRRYESANEFAADVNRYLSGEAVHAHPPSVGYRLRKFAHRNKGRVIAASFVFIALVGGGLGTTLGLVRATIAEADMREAFNQVSEEQVRTEKALEKATEEEHKARKADAASRQQLARQYVAQGAMLVADGNFADAAHWYIAALQKEQDLIDTERERVHRTRIAMTLDACPKPTAFIRQAVPIRRAAYSPNGRRIVTIAWRDPDFPELRVWDSQTGQPTTPVVTLEAREKEIVNAGMFYFIQFDDSGSRIVLVSHRLLFRIGSTALLETFELETGRKTAPSIRCISALQSGSSRVDHNWAEYEDPAKPTWPPRA